MPNGSVRLVDGQMEWSGGVDSGRPPTIASEHVPNGLKTNQLAFLINGTCRGGGITTRAGQFPLVTGAPWSGLYQGAWLYEPPFALPYIIMAVGGRIYRVNVDTDNSVVDLSAVFGKTLPPLEPLYHFCQGEEFLVIQAGDLSTNPLFYQNNGTVAESLTQSAGFLGQEIPPATAMDYYMGRLWYAIGRTYIAGDIVGGAAGTAPFDNRDAILHTTENPIAAAGDGFTVPSQAGNIRMLAHTAELDTALGQGRLLIGTPKAIYRCNVPVSRDDWTATTANKQPLQTVAQIRFGPVGDRSNVVQNGDIFYQTLEPAVRSLALATRFFQQWANTPISRNENRVLKFNDRALLRYASGIEFDNRLLQTALPFQTPVGVAHRGILPLDFDLISSLEEKLPPAWEGMLEGLDVLQMLDGDFGGLERAFAICVSRKTGEIQIWEMSTGQRFDFADRRITTVIETPAYTWGNPFQLKELDTLELWVDRLIGDVDFKVYYRPDQYPCYLDYHAWKECSAIDCTQDADDPCTYPTEDFCESFKATMRLPKAPASCIKSSGRPSNKGYQFQFKIVIKGFCRVRGLLAYALELDQAPYEGIIC